VFLACWLAFGHDSAWLALIYCFFMSLLIVATFIDFEHFIIPDEITFGGMAAGVVLSALVPGLHGTISHLRGGAFGVLGMGVGVGVVYTILRLGKLLFGRQHVPLPGETRIIFTEDFLYLPDEQIALNELFYRDTDVIQFHVKVLELPDRCYQDTLVRLSPRELLIGEDSFEPESIPHMEAVTSEIVLPREAMGLGDVKFMGAIGAFLGWQAVLFSLMVSSIIGSVVGVTLIVLGKREWSSRLPYGPYIAMAAVFWLFGGWRIFQTFFGAR